MLGGIWQFLKDPANLAVLGTIGAGIAAIAGGAWAVFTFSLPRKARRGARRRASPPIAAASRLAAT
jgi:hypothetical protein